jgi:hypothetical protein
VAVKAREKQDASIASREIRRNAQPHDRVIVERPRWLEDLARPPYKAPEKRVTEADRR